MTELYSERCTACRRDSPHVTEAEIAELHPVVNDWAMIDEVGIPKLDRQFKFRNFVQALEFTNALGELAESEGHHSPPDHRVGPRQRNLVDPQNPQPPPQRLHHGRQNGSALCGARAGGRVRPARDNGDEF